VLRAITDNPWLVLFSGFAICVFCENLRLTISAAASAFPVLDMWKLRFGILFVCARRATRGPGRMAPDNGFREKSICVFCENLLLRLHHYFGIDRYTSRE